MSDNGGGGGGCGCLTTFVSLVVLGFLVMIGYYGMEIDEAARVSLEGVTKGYVLGMGLALVIVPLVLAIGAGVFYAYDWSARQHSRRRGWYDVD